ncbi:hypothetical protein G9A89_003075 [Geosiphon pyriformis]|nr:hypothetical protein G9A89_003075 [Geosiphon pyriformis]
MSGQEKTLMNTKTGNSKKLQYGRVQLHVNCCVSRNVTSEYAQQSAREYFIHLEGEIHRKSVRFFTREFDGIVRHAESQNKKYYTKTDRKMLCWAHYRFRQRLIIKAEELGARVIIQNEAYTPKTCSQCDNIQRIGGPAVYNYCGIVIDRGEYGDPLGLLCPTMTM